MGQTDGSEKIRIVVNADDVGAHPIFTDASLAALATGRISSASVIVPGPDAERAMALLAARPDLDVGVHLCLTGDWRPLTPRDVAPSLYNARGTMWETQGEAAAKVRPHEAQLEFEAQLKRALQAGVRVTHLDAHMGCYLETRELFAAALAVARAHRIPLIAPYIPSYLPDSDRRLVTVSSYSGIYRISGGEESLPNRAAAYRELLSRLGPGIHYLFSHHGQAGPGSQELGDLDLRIDDFAFWTSDASSKLLAELGIELVGCAPLEEAFRAALDGRK